MTVGELREGLLLADREHGAIGTQCDVQAGNGCRTPPAHDVTILNGKEEGYLAGREYLKSSVALTMGRPWPGMSRSGSGGAASVWR